MNDSNGAGQEVLDWAIASLRDTPIPPGPSDLVQRQTLEALDSFSYRRRRWNRALVASGIAALIPFTIFVVQFSKHVAKSKRDARELVKRINRPAPNSSPIIATTQPDRPAPPPPTASEPNVVVASDASIRGRVFYRGPRPDRAVIDLRSCPQCSQMIDGPIYDDSLVINQDGTLRNVVVSITAGLPPGEQFVPSQAPVMLDQKGCTFHPHVVAAMVGQPIIVKNSDPILHSVHSMDAEQSPAFDFAQPTIGERRVDPLRAVETFQIRCDLHPWMNAWVRVFSHPFFSVTGDDGSFAIKYLPPGTYRIKAWHESLGVREQTITVVAGQPNVIDFAFDR